MEARPNGNNALALLQGRRHRPGCEREVRVGQVFEQQVPIVRVIVPGGIEAARHQRCRHLGGNLHVERDLLAARIPLRPYTLGHPSLQNKGAGGTGSGAGIETSTA